MPTVDNLVDDGECPVCETGTLTSIIEDFHLPYKGHTYIAKDFKFYVCNSCKEKFCSNIASEAAEPELRAHHAAVDKLIKNQQQKTI